jgi:protoporphyrin/coproporphyrin ferrochelatase
MSSDSLVHSQPKTGILLMNLGTPDSTATADVRAYLRQFLSDPKVLDMSALGRFALLNFIILPFRPKKTAEAYNQIWTDRGSPLLTNTEDLADKLRARVSPPIKIAMRYGNPSVASALDSFAAEGVDEIIAVPLFPHYAASSFGSAAEHVMEEAGKRWNVPAIRIASPFYDNPHYIRALSDRIKRSLNESPWDKLLFSYHGIPEHQCTKSDTTGGKHCFQTPTCCDTIVAANRHCYKAQCYATTRAVVKELGLEEKDYEVVFQSRLTKVPWIKPYADLRINELAKEGVKHLQVVCPSFISDCLETLEEIAIRAVEDFAENGGESLRLIPCLNAEDNWVEALATMLGQQPGEDFAQ